MRRTGTQIPLSDTLVRSSDKLRVRSALNPILWLCGISLSVGVFVIAIGFFKLDPFPETLLWIVVITLIFVPLFLTCYGFLYILHNLPDMLQSEWYQLKKKKMELSQEKGKPVEEVQGCKQSEDLNEESKNE